MLKIGLCAVMAVVCVLSKTSDGTQALPSETVVNRGRQVVTIITSTGLPALGGMQPCTMLIVEPFTM